MSLKYSAIAINRKQKNFSLPHHQRPKKTIVFGVYERETKGDKSQFATKFIGIKVI